jgi:hypothetical protein
MSWFWNVDLRLLETKLIIYVHISCDLTMLQQAPLHVLNGTYELKPTETDSSNTCEMIVCNHGQTYEQFQRVLHLKLKIKMHYTYSTQYKNDI